MSTYDVEVYKMDSWLYYLGQNRLDEHVKFLPILGKKITRVQGITFFCSA